MSYIPTDTRQTLGAEKYSSWGSVAGDVTGVVDVVTDGVVPDVRADRDDEPDSVVADGLGQVTVEDGPSPLDVCGFTDTARTSTSTSRGPTDGVGTTFSTKQRGSEVGRRSSLTSAVVVGGMSERGGVM